MNKLPSVRRRRTSKIQKAAQIGRTALAVLPTIRLARRGWRVAKVFRFGPAFAVAFGVLAVLRALRKRRKAETPWETAGGAAPLGAAEPARGVESDVTATKPHGDTLAEALPGQNGTVAAAETARLDPSAPGASGRK